MRFLLTTLFLMLLTGGCTTVHDLGGGRVVKVVTVEERSPFGTNAGAMKLVTCDDATPPTETVPLFHFSGDYANCQDVPLEEAKKWIPMSSQGQGGQIVQGVLTFGGFVALGQLMPASSGAVTNSSTVNTVINGGIHK